MLLKDAADSTNEEEVWPYISKMTLRLGFVMTLALWHTVCFFNWNWNHKSGNIIVGIICKPPDVPCSNFTDAFNDTLSQVYNDRKRVYTMGDFNVNLLLHDTYSSLKDFINMSSSNSFFSLIKKPTRITSGSTTLLNNIFTDEYSDHRTGIFFTDLSDHLPVFRS